MYMISDQLGWIFGAYTYRFSMIFSLYWKHLEFRNTHEELNLDLERKNYAHFTVVDNGKGMEFDIPTEVIYESCHC